MGWSNGYILSINPASGARVHKRHRRFALVVQAQMSVRRQFYRAVAWLFAFSEGKEKEKRKKVGGGGGRVQFSEERRELLRTMAVGS